MTRGWDMQGNWYNQQGFWAFFDNEGNIIASDYTGEKRVGVTLAKYNKMEKMANEAMGAAEQHKAKEDEYRNILIEKGLLKPELSDSERIEMLSNQVEQLANIVKQFAEREQMQAKRKVITPEIMPDEKPRGNK